MKQTAVEWLQKKLWQNNILTSEELELFEQAKEMEKKQIELSFLKGFLISADGYNGETLECELITDEWVKEQAKDFYNETFNK